MVRCSGACGTHCWHCSFDANFIESLTLERASISHSQPSVGDTEGAHARVMLQARPTSWSGTPPLPTMDLSHDSSVYNSFNPNVYSSVLNQTLCELDIDKLFEGLPEIYEDHCSGIRDADAVAQAVTVATSPAFPSTPPAQGSRPSSMCSAGSVEHEGDEHLNELSLAVRCPVRNAQAVLIRPQDGSKSLPPPVTVVVDRKVGRKGRGTAGHGLSGEFKMPAAAGAGKSNELEAKPLMSAVAHMVPRILPADLTVNEHAGMALPLHSGLDPQMCFRIPRRSRPGIDVPPTGNTRTQRTRYFDKVEHIVRERWRRDDMAGKFLALESLLPPSSKRDRSTIVEDSMKLVKSLQHRKEEALKKRSKLKQALACATQPPGVKLSRIIQKIGSMAVMSPPLESNGLPSSGVSTSKQPLVEEADGDDDDVEAANESADPTVPKFLSDCVHRFCVHSERSTGDIVIEMICEQVPNFHSGLMASMESLGLDILRCSVIQSTTKLICNITVKPFPTVGARTSSASRVVEGLNMAFQKQ